MISRKGLDLSTPNLDVAPVAEGDARGEHAPVGSRRHGKDPRRGIAHRVSGRPVVAGGAHHGDPPLDGVEGPDRDGIREVIVFAPPQGDRDHVHAVMDGGVEGGEDVRVVAPHI